MVLTNEFKNEQGRLLNECFLEYCHALGLNSLGETSELLGAATMFYLQTCAETLGAPMEELREDYVESLDNAYFEKQ